MTYEQYEEYQDAMDMLYAGRCCACGHTCEEFTRCNGCLRHLCEDCTAVFCPECVTAPGLNGQPAIAAEVKEAA